MRTRIWAVTAMTTEEPTLTVPAGGWVESLSVDWYRVVAVDMRGWPGRAFGKELLYLFVVRWADPAGGGWCCHDLWYACTEFVEGFPKVGAKWLWHHLIGIDPLAMVVLCQTAQQEVKAWLLLDSQPVEIPITEHRLGERPPDEVLGGDRMFGEFRAVIVEEVS